MPLHDWTRVDSGIFHSFQLAWVVHLKEALNGGLLPDGYYALSEQHNGRGIADVPSPRIPESHEIGGSSLGGAALAEALPLGRDRRSLSPRAAYRVARRTLAIRRVSGHRVVALVEIASPANKDRAKSVEQFVGKVEAALTLGVHVMVADLFPPGPHDPSGLNGALREQLSMGRSASSSRSTCAKSSGRTKPRGRSTVRR